MFPTPPKPLLEVAEELVTGAHRSHKAIKDTGTLTQPSVFHVEQAFEVSTEMSPVRTSNNFINAMKLPTTSLTLLITVS